jgi:hypothetical protein
MEKLIVAVPKFRNGPKNDARDIIMTLNNNKSLWKDDISAELVKYGDKKIGEGTHALTEIIWILKKCHNNGVLRKCA